MNIHFLRLRPFGVSRQRFVMRPDGRDTWTIYDTATSRPAVVEGLAQTGKGTAVADELVDLLNGVTQAEGSTH